MSTTSALGATNVLLPLLVAAVMLPAAPVQAQDLGRLFTSRSERGALNQLRIESQLARPTPIPSPVAPERTQAAAEPEGPEMSRLEINGLIRRGVRGPSTVWVNGAQVERGMVSREGLRVNMPGGGRDGVQVSLPSGLRSIRLKPGQAIDVETGAMLDAFERQPGEGSDSAIDLSSLRTPASEAKDESAAEEDEARESEPTESAASPQSGGGLTPKLLGELARMAPDEREAAMNALRAVGVLDSPISSSTSQSQ